MRIICGTNFSSHANKAALAAASLAARRGGTLSLMHVLDPQPYADPSKDLMDHLRESRQKRLDTLADSARRRTAKVETHVVEGCPATELTEFAARTDARLLVISAAGPIAPTRRLLGSVADQVARSSSVPSLTIRDGSSIEAWTCGKRPLKVMVAYDFTASAEAALSWAGTLREIAPCDITVAYVASAANERARLDITPPASPLYYPSGLRKFLEQELRHKCDAVLGKDEARFCVMADWGRPDSHLIEFARDNRVDLIVMGTRQRRGLARLGSVSRAVLHYAHMNVACVPMSTPASAIAADLPQFKRVLVPVDFSKSAAQVISIAYASVCSGGELRLVHVVPPQKPNGTAAHRKGSQPERHAGFAARMEALLPKTAIDRGIETCVEVVEHEDPAVGICQLAERIDADLICIGSRGRSRWKEALFGSVAQEVMTRSNRPVLVIHGAGQRSDVKANKTETLKSGG